mgnify:CR=1 FL=1
MARGTYIFSPFLVTQGLLQGLFDIELGIRVSYMYIHYAIGILGPKSSKKEVTTIIFAGGFVSRGLIGSTRD